MVRWVGGGSTTINYQPPQIQRDDSFEKFLNYQREREQAADERAAAERAESKRDADARKAAGAAGYAGLRAGAESELRSGLVSYQDAASRLRDYAAKYDLTPPEADVSALSDIYQKEVRPGQLQTGIEATYEELLGRPATEQEKSTALSRFEKSYYRDINDLKDTVLKGSEYQKKFNQNYLDNYYDTMFGKQTTDEKGERTGKRAFTFAQNLLPQYGGDLAGRTKITTPDFGSSFTGTPTEIEEQQQNLRDTRQYLYSAGLTNLQGEIDKETQSLKNEGTKELAKISAQGDIYKQLVGAFSFS
jgi:hypothetical protein